MESSSLAERLGYGPADRLLIVNCDDFGSSHGANVGTLRAMTQGIATSATLMVPCPWAREAARMARDLPVGVHLTLTSEYPGYRWCGLTDGASLHDDEGFLASTTAAAVRRLDPSDARAECAAQIEAALSWGVDVTHLDAHMNVLQGRGDLFDVYLDLAAAFRLPVRIFPPGGPVEQPSDALERARARGLLSNEHTVYPWPRMTRDVVVDEIPRLPAGVSELLVHPVTDGDELRAYDPDHADIRAHDAACLTDPEIAGLLRRHGIRRISYREIRDVQRAGP